MHWQCLPPSLPMCQIRLIRTLCWFRSEPLQELKQSFTNRDDSREDSELQSLINRVKVGAIDRRQITLTAGSALFGP